METFKLTTLAVLIPFGLILPEASVAHLGPEVQVVAHESATTEPKCRAVAVRPEFRGTPSHGVSAPSKSDLLVIDPPDAAAPHHARSGAPVICRLDLAPLGRGQAIAVD